MLLLLVLGLLGSTAFALLRRNVAGLGLLAHIAARETASGTATLTATPTPRPLVPTKPNGVRTTVIDWADIQLSWIDAAAGRARYAIYEGDRPVATVEAGTMSYVARNLDAASFHCFRLYVYSAAGRSDWSDSACALTLGLPPPYAPSNLQATATNDGGIAGGVTDAGAG